MPHLVHGALIEYGTDLIGPIPNVVIFQFNPESLTRNLEIPPRPGGINDRENSQAGEKTIETITLKAHFSAAEMLKEDKFLARHFGIGPQLCALEKMVNPSSLIAGAIAEAIDKIGKAVGLGGSDSKDSTQPIPREKYPRILFLWGRTRIVPVTINTLRITELEYDQVLSPLRAEVDLEMAIHPIDPCADDWLASGAMTYTTIAKEAQAIANLVNTAEQIEELIPF